ncbi:MAG: hypothetical protein ACRYGI_08615 [Janthinobacterium lividum]
MNDGNDASLLLFHGTQTTNFVSHRLCYPGHFLKANSSVASGCVLALADQAYDLILKARFIIHDDRRIGNGFDLVQSVYSRKLVDRRFMTAG